MTSYSAIDTHITRLKRAQWKNALMTAMNINLLNGIKAGASEESRQAIEALVTKMHNAADEYNEAVSDVLRDFRDVLKNEISD